MDTKEDAPGSEEVAVEALAGVVEAVVETGSVAAAAAAEAMAVLTMEIEEAEAGVATPTPPTHIIKMSRRLSVYCLFCSFF